jgi:hypothetical protein
MATQAPISAGYELPEASGAGVPWEVGADAAPPEPSAWAATWSSFWQSRLLVWVAGCAAMLLFGVSSSGDPTGISSAFGRVGNVLMAPAVRWDAIWYLQIAQHGYQSARETAFFPLYPLVMRAASLVTGSLAIAGVLVSLAGLLSGLLILRRLTELELGPRVGSAAVELLAFGPVAVYLSAVYTEGLFLALSVGTLYSARRGRWALAGALGALAAATRITGVVLFVPVVLMFLYGPRADRAAIVSSSRWRPRYRFGPALLWSLLIPLAAAAFAGYLAARGFGAAGSVSAQQHFSGHRFVLPFVGAWQGLEAAINQFRLELIGAHSDSFQTQAMFQFGALLLSALALVATFRRLPFAYGAYAVCGLLVVLSVPTAWDPLRGLARYATLLVPLYMGAADWAVEHGAVRRLRVGSVVLLCLLTAQFATWHMVGAPAL